MAKDAIKLAEAGAPFSYGRHFRRDSDQWLAEGLFGWEIPHHSHFGDGTSGRALLSLGFSRIDFGGDGVPKKASPRFKDEANLLAIGATYESLLLGPRFWGFEDSSFRFNALYKSVWDFQSHIPTAELEWFPYHGKLGLGSFNTEYTNFLVWRFDARLHADFGHVASDGDWTSSKQDDTFAHFGPRFGVTLMPFPISRPMEKNPLVIGIEYAYYQPIGGESNLSGFSQQKQLGICESLVRA